jgi:hypothetical protein
MELAISPLVSFILQAVVLLSFIPTTFIAYRLLREPKKQEQARWELSQFGLEGTHDFDNALSVVEYSLLQYLLPLGYIFLIFLALYSMTSPYIIQLGTWKGLLEETANIFGLPTTGSTFARDVLVGRLMFWGWLGAYIYSVDRTIRHYLAQDLTPNVYVTIAKRFTVAFVVGTLIGIAIATSNHAIRLSFDNSLTTAYVVCFFVGLFPETGIKWIKNAAGRVLRQTTEDEQIPLSTIEGISVWHEGRLDQEGIVNVQNLASANLLELVANTPFDVGQIVDWVDQAILMMHTSPEQLEKLKGAGIRSGTILIDIIKRGEEPLSTTTGLSPEELLILKLAITSATNTKLIMLYRRHLSRQESHDPEPQPAKELPPISTQASPEAILTTVSSNPAM